MADQDTFTASLTEMLQVFDFWNYFFADYSDRFDFVNVGHVEDNVLKPKLAKFSAQLNNVMGSHRVWRDFDCSERSAFYVFIGSSESGAGRF